MQQNLMISISDRYDYKNICKLAYENEEIFNKFKSNGAYNEILEHVSKEQGDLYLKYLNIQFPNFIEKINSFKKNDSEKNPKIFDEHPNTFENNIILYF